MKKKLVLVCMKAFFIWLLKAIFKGKLSDVS